MADDDIIELTEVVKPAEGAEPGGEPAGEDQPDFGADLDALLSGLGDTPSQPVAKEAETARPAPAAPQGSPTPDGHVVNPNEEIDMPSLTDLDALLQELGVEDDAPQTQSGPAPVNPDALSDDAGGDAPAQDASPAPAAQAGQGAANPGADIMDELLQEIEAKD
ncbi:hypothetical protein LJC36_05360, partial [Desulfovibrio sp. OttesenSCG-928-C14]|nr:hypothetical protein [Desulfovibrio sp. OttesenSCG-928-C14]